MSLKSENKEAVIFASLMLAAMLIFAFVLFKSIGIMVVIGIALMSLPFYLILSRFDIPESEKFLFSIAIGVTILPSITYLLGLLIPFRMAMAISFLIFMGLAVIMVKFKKK